jgi:microsomal dipeptidase-like Zn-dependent dipeptidase
MKIIDIHCHPSTKIYFGHHIEDTHHPLADLLPTGMHVDFNSMKAGNVGCAVSVHYIVENGLIDSNKNRLLMGVLNIMKVFDDDILLRLTEKGNRGATNTLGSIQATNAAIANAPAEVNAIIPRNFVSFKTAWDADKTIFLHSIEGGHSLSNDQPIAMVEQYAREGVCQITIAHFFTNIVVSSQGGIPPETKHLLGLGKGAIPQKINGLNPEGLIGEKIIHKILDEGIILDLVHCPISARQRIYEINRERQLQGKKLRPLVFSHTGIRSCINPDNEMFEGDLMALPSNEEVKEIIACRGVIGVIFMNYWLDGKEEDNFFKKETGLELVINTMLKLKEIGLGSCEHIAIGSDLDGFTQVPDDLVTAGDMQKIPIALNKAGFTQNEIRQICHENYIRVLELGWGK